LSQLNQHDAAVQSVFLWWEILLVSNFMWEDSIDVLRLLMTQYVVNRVR